MNYSWFSSRWRISWPTVPLLCLQTVLSYFYYRIICLNEAECLNFSLISYTDHCLSAIWTLSRLVGIWSAALWNACRTGEWCTHTHTHTDIQTLTQRQCYFLCNCPPQIVRQLYKGAHRLLKPTFFPHVLRWCFLLTFPSALIINVDTRNH